jgi:hypothetical protein
VRECCSRCDNRRIGDVARRGAARTSPCRAAQDGDGVPRHSAHRRSRAGSAARAQRPSRYACGTRPASWSHQCICSSPRASAGFSMLPASIAPSALPAPTMVCNSSMKQNNCAFSLRALLPARPSGALQTRRGISRPRSSPAIGPATSTAFVFEAYRARRH